MRFSDYQSPDKPSAVIAGRLVPLDDDAIARLAFNAMELSGSSPLTQRAVDDVNRRMILDGRRPATLGGTGS